jgi:hypothetical protein
MTKILTIMCVLLIVSCKKTKTDTVYIDREIQEEVESEEQENENKETTPTELKTQTTLESVVDEPLVELLFVENLRVNDLIKISITGKRFVPQFEDQIIKDSIVSWKEKKCLDKNTCLKINRQGTCKLHFREQRPELEEVIDLTQSTNHHFTVMVGNFKVDVGTPIQDESGIYHFSFTVLENMLEEGTELNLAVFSQQDVDTLPVGFLNFENCPHSKKEDFETKLNRDVEDVHLINVEEYNVSVKVIY